MYLDIENVFYGFIQELMYQHLISFFPRWIALAVSVLFVLWIFIVFVAEFPKQSDSGKTLMVSTVVGFGLGFLFMEVHSLLYLHRGNMILW
jgi:hypothetical protein